MTKKHKADYWGVPAKARRADKVPKRPRQPMAIHLSVLIISSNTAISSGQCWCSSSMIWKKTFGWTWPSLFCLELNLCVTQSSITWHSVNDLSLLSRFGSSAYPWLMVYVTLVLCVATRYEISSTANLSVGSCESIASSSPSSIFKRQGREHRGWCHALRKQLPRLKI